MTLSGTGIASSSHWRSSAAVSTGSYSTVSASIELGRETRAYVRARMVGLCSRLTRTIAWTREGSVTSVSSIASSSAIRS